MPLHHPNWPTEIRGPTQRGKPPFLGLDTSSDSFYVTDVADAKRTPTTDDTWSAIAAIKESYRLAAERILANG